MVDIFIDPLTHDISLEDNQMRLTASVEELTRQKVAVTLLAFRGEWFANQTYGVPYLQQGTNTLQLLGKTNKNIADTEIKDAILTRDGVVSITKYESSLDSQRNLIVSAEVLTETGETVTIVFDITEGIPAYTGAIAGIAIAGVAIAGTI